MGIEISQDLIQENHVSSEQRLWRHVLIQAFEEAKFPQSDRKSSIYKMEAHEWIIQDQSDFETICWWSGWDPEHVREQYFKAIKRGDITFNHRQVKWIEYYKKYLNLKDTREYEKRKVLRQQLENARAAVFIATTALVSNFIVSQRV